MKLIALSTTCWAKKFSDIQDCITNIAKIGFESIELGSAHKFELNMIQKVKAVQQEYSLSFSIHAPFPPPKKQFILNPASLHSPTLKKTNECIINSIEVARELNAKIVGIHPGFLAYPTLPVNKTRPERFANYKKAFSTAVSSIEKFCDYAYLYDIEVLVENLDFYHEGYMFVREDEFLSLFKVINAKNLGFLLDIGHLNYSARNLGFDMIEFITKLEKVTRMIHIHDNNYLYDQHLPPGDGNIDFITCLTPLKKTLKKIPLVLEMYQDVEIKVIKRAKHYLRELLKSV